MKKIVHLITNDKFTAGYINFMKLYLYQFDHMFIVSKWSNGEHLTKRIIADNENEIIEWNRVWELVIDSKVKNELESAYKVIISGFSFELPCSFWSKSIWNKTYIHFWGRDFYDLIEWNSQPITKRVSKKQKLFCFRRAIGFIFLIEGEYERFRAITGLKKELVYVAPMPRDVVNVFPYNEYFGYSTDIPIRIVVGNSATKENRHKEVLLCLEKFKNEEIEIYCPLSYGDMNYANEIAELGKDIFGDKFNPIYNWMSMNDYYVFLSTCCIGIFNSDRQQSMGNINTMLILGKKVFLNRKSSMCKYYSSLEYSYFFVDDIKDMTIDELIEFNESFRNKSIGEKQLDPNLWRDKWVKVLE